MSPMCLVLVAFRGKSPLLWRNPRLEQSAGTGSAHVDTCVIGDNLSLVFGEEKREHGLPRSWDDANVKLKGGFPEIFYGSISFLMVYAAASTQFQWGILRPDGTVAAVGPILDAKSLYDRIKIVTSFINLHRILRFLLNKAPKPQQRMPLHRPIKRPGNTTVEVKGKSAEKMIEDCDTFFQETGTSFEVVKAAHVRANSCDALVHSKEPARKKVTGKRKRSKTTVMVYKVEMTTLGYRRTLHDLDEAGMKDAVRACLQALAHLHAAVPPICMCDVRLPNVLWRAPNSQPFLTDLELAHSDPWKVGNMWLADWEEPSEDTLGTLNPDDIYTKESDVYQVGVMLASCAKLSAEGTSFVAVLKTKLMSAEQALQHPYLT